MDGNDMKMTGGCPVMHNATNRAGRSNKDWWPNQLNLRILNPGGGNPIGASLLFSHRAARHMAASR